MKEISVLLILCILCVIPYALSQPQINATWTFTTYSTPNSTSCWPTTADYCSTSTSSCGGGIFLSEIVYITYGLGPVPPAGYVLTNVQLSIKRYATEGTVKWSMLGLTCNGVDYSATPSLSAWSYTAFTENYTSFVGKTSWTQAEVSSTSFGIYWQTNHTGIPPNVAVIDCAEVIVTFTNSSLISPSTTPSVTPSRSRSPSASPSPVSPSATPSPVSPSTTPSASPSPVSPSTTPSRTPSSSITPSVTPTRSRTPSSSPSVNFTPSSSSSHSKKSNSNVGIIVGVVVGSAVLAAAVIVTLLLIRKKKQHHENAPHNSSLELNTASNTTNDNNNAHYQAMGSSSEYEANRNVNVPKRESELDYRIKYSELVLDKEVGRGAFGVVWKGKWRSNNVAVKKMITENMNNKQMDDFIQEMTLMKSLRPSPNVVLLLGVCDDPLCVITEFCESGSLLSLLRSDKPMDWSLQMKIVTGIAKGMLHLHLEGIVHRDLAARNVLLTATYEPKISDFGLSRFVSNEQDSAKTTSNVGPLKWMAPECIRDREYSKASDVWAYGITLIEIFTRTDPYGKMDSLSVATRVSTGELVPVIPENVPTQLAKMMERFFEYKGSGRPDFQRICDDLENLQ